MKASLTLLIAGRMTPKRAAEIVEAAQNIGFIVAPVALNGRTATFDLQDRKHRPQGDAAESLIEALEAIGAPWRTIVERRPAISVHYENKSAPQARQKTAKRMASK